MRAGAPEGTVMGRGYGGDTLKAAQIQEAAGIVAGTDDAVNLSLVMTACELNPQLFLVVRQNAEENDALLRAARVDLVAQSPHIMANRILAHISTSPLTDFLRLALPEKDVGAAPDQTPVSGPLDFPGLTGICPGPIIRNRAGIGKDLLKFA